MCDPIAWGGEGGQKALNGMADESSDSVSNNEIKIVKQMVQSKPMTW